MLKNQVIKALAILFLLGGLSCTQRSKPIPREEYPDFSETAMPMPKESDGITLCTSKPSRPHYHVVEIRQMKFQPSELAVKRGDTVVWVNCDITMHDVTEETKKAWQSTPLLSKQSWMKVISESANYFCSIHLVMKGKVTVESASTIAQKN